MPFSDNLNTFIDFLNINAKELESIFNAQRRIDWKGQTTDDNSTILEVNSSLSLLCHFFVFSFRDLIFSPLNLRHIFPIRLKTKNATLIRTFRSTEGLFIIIIIRMSIQQTQKAFYLLDFN